MKLYELLNYAKKNEIKFSIDNDILKVSGNEKSIDDKFLKNVKENKGSLLGYYQGIETAPNNATFNRSSSELSFSQRRMYFLHLYNPEITHFNVPVHLKFTGCFQKEVFEAALQATFRRHGALCTSYHLDGSTPVQRIDLTRVPQLEYIDLSLNSKDISRDELFNRKCNSLINKCFDLHKAPLHRSCLFKIDEGLFDLVMVFHHLLVDAWSMLKLVDEIACCYNSILLGKFYEKKASAIDYIDYVCWQRHRSEIGYYDVAKSFWKERLKGANELLNLPLDKSRLAVQTFVGEEVSIPFSGGLRSDVNLNAKALGTNEYIYLFCIYTILLHKLTGTTDILVGTDTFGREHQALKDVIGYFVNQTVIRAEVKQSHTFSEYIRFFGEQVLASLEYQELPYDMLLEQIKPERNTSYHPVFQVKFLYNNYVLDSKIFNGVNTGIVDWHHDRSEMDLTMQIESDCIKLIFNKDLFYRETVRRWGDYYISLLKQTIVEPELVIDNLLSDIIAKEARSLCCGQQKIYPCNSLIDVILYNAEVAPNRTALVDECKSISYQELQIQVNTVASGLMALGIGAQKKIGIMIPRSAEMVIAMLSVLRVGAVFIPLDIEYPLERIEAVLTDCNADIVITNQDYINSAHQCSALPFSIESLYELSEDTPGSSFSSFAQEDIVYTLYTSGSTGQPKGVHIPYRAFHNLCYWYKEFTQLDSTSNTLLMIPFVFDASLKNIITPLLVGGCLVLNKKGRFDPDVTLDLIKRYKIDMLCGVPSGFSSLLKSDQANQYARLQSLRFVTLGGEVLQPATVLPWLTNPKCRTKIANIYGPTECTDISVAYVVNVNEIKDSIQIPIGRAIPNTEAWIVDEHLNPLPQGGVGELILSGVNVGCGYSSLEQETLTKFVRFPLTGSLCYRTGDYCRYDNNGNIVYLGRRDNQIKIRGKRVEVGEIVHQLSKLLPSRDISVQLYKKDKAELLLAFIDGGEGALTPEQINFTLLQKLPRHMVPARILFLDSIPLTLNGKVCEKSLIAMFESLQSSKSIVSDEFTHIEHDIASVWEQLLHTPVKNKEDDFFTLGGDSILSIEAVTELKQKGIDVSVADIFKYPSLQELGKFVSESTPTYNPESGIQQPVAAFALINDSDKARLPEGLEDAYPLTSLQLGMLFHGLLDDGGSTYHDVFSFELSFDYDEAMFCRAISKVVEIQPLLRTGFDLGSYSVPMQLVYAKVDAKIELKDICCYTEEEQVNEIESVIARIKETPFSLEGPSLIRFTILRRGENRIQCVVDSHHAILDGWSMSLVQRQIFEYYRYFRFEEPLSNVFDTGYMRFADYVATVIDQDSSSASASYWNCFCQTLPVITPLNSVRRKGIIFQRRHRTLDTILTRDLEKLSARTGVTLKTLLIMAHGQMLRTLTGQTSVLSGITDNGRLETKGAQNIVGLFLNVVPVLIPGDNSWSSLAAYLRKAEAEAKPHRRYALANILQCNTDISIDAIFTYTNFRVATELVKSDWLEVTMGEQYEEVNFKCSTHVSGNVVDGLLITLSSRIGLSDNFAEKLLDKFVESLCAMVNDFDARIPLATNYPLPVFSLEPQLKHVTPVRWLGSLDTQTLSDVAEQLVSQITQHSNSISSLQVISSLSICDGGSLLLDGGIVKGVGVGSDQDAAYTVVQGHAEGWQYLLIRMAPVLLEKNATAAAELLNRYLALTHDAEQIQAACDSGSYWVAIDNWRCLVSYWHRCLADSPLSLLLPLDHPRKTDNEMRIDLIKVAQSTRAAITSWAAQRQVSNQVAWISVWTALLARLSGQDDLVVGLFNMAAVPAQRVGGLRLRLERETDVSSWLEHVQTRQNEAIARALPSLEDFARVSPMAIESALGSPFQACVILQSTPPKGAISCISLACDLALHLRESNGKMEAEIEYRSDLFDQTTIKRWLGHMDALASEILLDDSRSIDQLSLLQSSQREQVLFKFNKNKTVLGCKHLIQELFEAQVCRDGLAIALESEGVTLSYGELNLRANQLAHYLIASGLNPDDRVVICTERGFDTVVGLLGVLKAGGAYVPLDPSYPRERLDYMLADCAPKWVLGQSNLRDLLPEPENGAQVLWLDDASMLAAQPEHNPDARTLELTARHLAYVIYTSGSTGRPKGVMIQHDSVINLWTALRDAIYQDLVTPLRVAVNASFAFDASVKMWVQLLSGASLLVVPQEVRFDGAQLLNWIQRNQVDVFDCTPMQLYLLLDQGLLETSGHRPQAILVGGEAISAGLWKRLGECTSIRFFNVYGPTESTVDVTITEILESNVVVNIGRPLGNTQIYIVDRYFRPVPIGMTGEILIGGVQVARGYLNDSVKTAERFVDHPFKSSDRKVYRTGDLGRWRADGTIEYLGRNDDQVKLRGFRIELGEIESQLEQCQGVSEVVVVLREERAGDKRLVAYMVAREGVELSATVLRDQLMRKLADYMVPSAFVILPALPLTANGKLNRNALPAPKLSAMATQPYAPPQGEVEEALARIWAELLGVERVGRHDNFFDLGGHSLIAVQVSARLRVVLGVEVALRDLLSHTELAKLAATVREAERVHGTIMPVERSGPQALSFAQQRLWFLDQLNHAVSVAYHMPASLKLHGSLDGRALQAALDRIVARHEILRTRFEIVEGTPMQVIATPDTPFLLTNHDLRELVPAECQEMITQLSVDEATAEFELAQGPLIRGRLIRLGEDSHVLLLTLHHIISDGWSIGVLIREFVALYAAYSEGRPDPLSALPLQYADYSAWQRQYLQGEVLDKLVEYWSAQLDGVPALLELPTDRVRPASESYVGASVAVSLSARLTSDLRALSRRHGVTLFMTLLAAWSLLLSRLSGQDELVVGTSVANRKRQELEPLVGFFINTLALRVRIDGAMSVSALLKQVKEMTLDAYSQQDLPFDQVVEAVKPVRSLSYHPIFQTILTLNNTPPAKLTLAGLELEELESNNFSTKFDLSLLLNENSEELRGALVYACDLFDRSTIERWLEHLQTLLAAMASGEDLAVAGLPLLRADERNSILTVLNDTALPLNTTRLLHQWFEDQVKRDGAAVALESGGVTLSYSELNRRANQLAHYLIASGICPDDRVAICTERGFDMMIGLLGILKAGGAYVPLDPGYPRERLAYMLVDSAPKWVLSQSILRDLLPEPENGARMLWLDDISVLSVQLEHDPDARALQLTARNLAYVIYTSGSTGRPKGVMVEHRSVVNVLSWMNEDYDTSDVVLQKTPFSFDASIRELFCTLSTGAKLVLARPGGHRDASYLQALVERTQVSILHFVPTMLQVFLDRLSEGQCPSLRKIFCGGEALSSATVKRVYERLPQVRLQNLYGPTEATVDVTAWKCPHELRRDRVPIGVPQANTQLYILDTHGQPVPIGVVGEIHIGGVQVARGYLNRPTLTAEYFFTDPFSSEPDARLYRTGDIGRWLVDGSIEYLGRNDDQVKLRGFRIELGEVETQLTQCEGVREAVVILREDIPGEKRLVAYLVVEGGVELVLSALREQLLQELADYMVPSVFVTLPTLPQTLNGKLSRGALPVPELDVKVTNTYAPPQGEIEEALARIWAGLLGVERVGRSDNFFELGGHSLLVGRMLNNVFAEFDLLLEFSTVFNHPTLASFTECLLATIASQITDETDVDALIDDVTSEVVQ